MDVKLATFSTLIKSLNIMDVIFSGFTVYNYKIYIVYIIYILHV